MPPVARARRVSTDSGGTGAGRYGAAELTPLFSLPRRSAGDPRSGRAYRGHQGRAKLPLPLHGRGREAARAGELRFPPRTRSPVLDSSMPGSPSPREISIPVAALETAGVTKGLAWFSYCAVSKTG